MVGVAFAMGVVVWDVAVCALVYRAADADNWPERVVWGGWALMLLAVPLGWAISHKPICW